MKEPEVLAWFLSEAIKQSIEPRNQEGGYVEVALLDAPDHLKNIRVRVPYKSGDDAGADEAN